jgi:hypothetical protein
MAAQSSSGCSGWLLLPWLTALLFTALPAAAQGPAGAAPAYVEVPVQSGDTLIGIGRRLLRDPAQWPVLARENGLRNSNLIGSRSVLRIPTALLRSEAVPAQVLSSSGNVRTGETEGGTPLRAGATVAEGSRLRTGADGNATLQLVDGSVLRLRAESQLTVQESRRFPGVGAVRSAVRLDEGRVEVKSPLSRGGQPGFEVRTPQGVLGVRGTEFRVAAEGAAERTLGEVLEGSVQMDSPRAGQRVGGGLGSVLGADGAVLPPVALLAMPDVRSLPQLQEKVLLRFDFPPLAGARAYRAQIARDGSFDSVLVDITLLAPPLRVPGLPDGAYVLRLRASDERGLEGRAADLPFKLKARPEAPLPAAPQPGARVIGRVDFRWAANPEARAYWLQVADNSQFTLPVLERRDISETTFSLEALPPGVYHWRVTSLGQGVDVGPLGEAGSFEVLPTPPVAPPPRATVSDQGVSLAWPATAGQQFDVQLARDAAFTQPLLNQRLLEPAYSFEPPGSGRFYVRLRTIEADGYVGPFGAAQFFEVPPCLRSAGKVCVRASGEPVLTQP